MTKLSADAVIIGGGAAGMMCSLVAAQRGLDIILLEPNRMLGRKVRITGKGRCNVTNNCDIKDFLDNIPGDGRFLYSALSKFSPRDTMRFFESLGLPLKTERGNRVFPVSDNANDVAGTLTRNIERSGVQRIRESAEHIICENDAVCGVKTGSGVIGCRAAVICTGGLSYPLTGSTGAGYKMARELGHSITTCRPSLVPLESNDEYCAQMQGFSLKNVALSAYEDDKLIFRELGEMLFTHFGVSGPLVLSASSHMRNFGRAKYRLSIDLKPALDEKKLDARLLRDFEKYANRDFANSLCDLAGKTMIPVLVELSGIPPEEKVKRIRDTVSSLRLDSVLASGFSLSRGKAAEAVTSGKVQVNWTDCQKPDRPVSQGDTLTLRGLGKCVLEEVGNQTKKGRVFITLKRYL